MSLFSTPARPVSRARYFAAATVDASTDVVQAALETYRVWVLRNAARRLSQEPATAPANTEDASYADMRGM